MSIRFIDFGEMRPARVRAHHGRIVATYSNDNEASTILQADRADAFFREIRKDRRRASSALRRRARIMGWVFFALAVYGGLVAAVVQMALTR
jgi:hypothetical protein